MSGGAPVRLPLAALAILLALVATGARADVYRCVDAGGEIVYQDYSCPGGQLLMKTGPAPATRAAAEAPAQPAAAPAHPSRWPWVLLAYVAMSLLCWFGYWFDKRAAIAGERRVPERTLHAMELMGGWPGALAAQRLLRHKTRKLSFQLVFWLIVLLHLAGWADWLSHGAVHRLALGLLR